MDSDEILDIVRQSDAIACKAYLQTVGDLAAKCAANPGTFDFAACFLLGHFMADMYKDTIRVHNKMEAEAILNLIIRTAKHDLAKAGYDIDIMFVDMKSTPTGS